MRVLIPLPDHDFDVTEVSVPWRLLASAGHDTVFATEHGGFAPEADRRLLDGVIFGRLGAYEEPKAFYRQLVETTAFQRPLAWADLRPGDYDGLLLAGGHAPGMRQYLSSTALEDKVAEFWRLGRPVGAICHGVLVLARTRDPRTGRSVIADRRTTCLPKYMERSAYYLTAWRLGRYYRTYPAYVQDEVTAALNDPASSSVDHAPSVGAPPRTTAPLSSSRTVTTCLRAGRATHTCSPSGSGACSRRPLAPQAEWNP